MHTNIWFWVGFVGFVLAMLALDLGVFHRTPHEVHPKEAATWTAVWVALALVFAGGLFAFYGQRTSLTFLTGYVIEESLSVDNIFVIVLIFEYFRVPKVCQHRVLFYGIVGALAMRGLFIGLGSVLIARFSWILYVFGAMLVITGIRMAIKQDDEFDGDENPIVREPDRLRIRPSDGEGRESAQAVGFRVRRDGLEPTQRTAVGVTSSDQQGLAGAEDDRSVIGSRPRERDLVALETPTARVEHVR